MSPGALTTGAWSSASGVATTTSASYSEVGTFSMKLVDSTLAAVDSADGSTAIEMNIESPVFDVGRFVPDHFDLLPASIPGVQDLQRYGLPQHTLVYL